MSTKQNSDKIIYLVVGADSETEKILVYSKLLKDSSPVFRNLVESMDPSQSELRIEGVAIDVMKTVIEFICLHQFEEEAPILLTGENVHEILTVARKFQLDDLMALCYDFLNRMEINEGNCIQHLLKAQDYVESFKSKCYSRILSSLTQLCTTNDFADLSIEHILKIVNEGQAQNLCSNDRLCAAVAAWMTKGSPERCFRIKELVDEFPGTEHKKLIVEALRKIPNPHLHTLAFDLLQELYSSEPRKTATATRTVETEVPSEVSSVQENIASSSRGNDDDDDVDMVDVEERFSSASIRGSDPVVSARKRPSSLHMAPEEPPCSRSKRGRNQPQVAVDVITLISLCSSSSENSPTSSSASTVPMLPTCSIFFVDYKDGNKFDLYSGDLHFPEFKIVNRENDEVVVVPKKRGNYEFASIQYFNDKIFCMSSKNESARSNTSNVFPYEVETGKWNPDPVKMDKPRPQFRSVSLGDFVYMVCDVYRTSEGDNGIDNKMFRCDFVSGSSNENWTLVTENFTEPRRCFGLAIWNHAIYSVGGQTMHRQEGNDVISGGWVASRAVDVFSPENEAWTKVRADLSSPRWAIAAVSTEKELYAIGGWGTDPEKFSVFEELTSRGAVGQAVEKLPVVEFLSAGSSRWEYGPPLIKPRANASAVYCKEQNAIFVFGGDSDTNPTTEKLNLGIDPKVWTLVPNLTLPRNACYSPMAYRPCC